MKVVPDKREKLWAKQRAKRGFDDRETWSLNTTLAKWLAPRLKRFREVSICHPVNLTAKQWDKVLSKIQFSIDLAASDDYFDLNKMAKVRLKYTEGLELFKFYFDNLWW